jgi:membrane-bound serine protease (ClpP class)
MSGVNARRSFYLFLIAFGAVMWFSGTFSQILAQAANRDNTGVILKLEGAVTPASADYLAREIETANANNIDLIIMEIDTPGGLITSMKKIIKSILASDAPVVTYVSPQGAQSASAGLYIMYSSHVSAMAPATNTGSATPIELGGAPGRDDSPFDGDLPFEPAPETEETVSEEAEGESPAVEEEAPEPEAAPEEPVDISNDASMRGKIIEDSVAYIRSLAEERGRNAEWAEQAVRPPSASITAREALELGVIEIVADDLDDLLQQLDGRTVKTAAGEVTIDTTDIKLERVEPALWERILGFFADPNVAAILLSLGTLGITAEIWNPGSIFPGTFGLICLLLGLYSVSVLSGSALALSIMGIGLVLVIIEAYTPTFGLAGLSGLAIFGAGLYFLFPEQFRVNTGLIVLMMLIGGVFLALILVAIVGSRSHGPLIGAEAIRRREGFVDEWDNEKGEGMVIVEGERWRARSKSPLKVGDRVKVTEVDGLVLDVKSLSGAPTALARFMPKRKEENSAGTAG